MSEGKKVKKLNGIPGNIADQYLSAMNYYKGAYMADWIYFTAKEHNVSKIRVDVLNNQVFPAKANMKALTYFLFKLRGIIKNQTNNNGFDYKFIKKANLNFEISSSSKIIFCNPVIEDINGLIYTSKKTINATAGPINNFFIKNNERTILGKSFHFVKQLFNSLFIFLQTHS